MTRRAQINGIITDKILEITGDACSQRMVLGNPRKSASFQSKLSDYESICKTPVMKVIINEKKVHVELKNWEYESIPPQVPKKLHERKQEW